MADDERALCAATAALLRASRVIANLGIAITFASALALVLVTRSLNLVATVGFAGTALVGLAERYLAFRLALDAALFEALASGIMPSLSTMDSALQALALRSPVQAIRPLAARVGGARSLLRRHALVVAAQLLTFALALLAQGWR